MQTVPGHTLLTMSVALGLRSNTLNTIALDLHDFQHAHERVGLWCKKVGTRLNNLKNRSGL